jgi:hypothetical protein
MLTQSTAVSAPARPVRQPAPDHNHLVALYDEVYGADAPDQPEVRYTLTDAGRRALAMARCFGPWPTVAEAFAEVA